MSAGRAGRAHPIGHLALAAVVVIAATLAEASSSIQCGQDVILDRTGAGDTSLVYEAAFAQTSNDWSSTRECRWTVRATVGVQALLYNFSLNGDPSSSSVSVYGAPSLLMRYCNYG